MAVHNTLGKTSEDLAVIYLEGKGYEILFRNWRHSHYEIDIIAFKNQVLHFIEVKARTTTNYGFPEQAVDKRKFRHLLKAADAFLFQYPQYKHVQYDIIAIIHSKRKSPEYFLIEDVYLSDQ